MITSITALGNLAQLLATIFFMSMSLVFYLLINHSLIHFSNLFIATLFVSYFLLFLALFVIYLKPSIVLKFIEKWNYLKNYTQRLKTLNKIGLKIKFIVLFLSGLRFMIFYLQYYLLLVAFQIELPGIELFIFLGLLFGLVTFIPSLFMGNIGTREAIALYLASSSLLGVFAPLISFLIWVVNVGISSLIGGLIYSYKKQKELK